MSLQLGRALSWIITCVKLGNFVKSRTGSSRKHPSPNTISVTLDGIGLIVG